MTRSDDYSPAVHYSRRSMAPACTTMFVLAAISLIYLYMTTHSRYQVIGQLNKAAGCRIEYTVSTRYRNMETVDDHTLKASHELEYWMYMPTPMLVPVRLFYTYILRRSDASTEPEADADMGGALKAHEIQEITYLGKSPEGHLVNAQGYVKPGDIAGVANQVSEEEGLVSDCPSTWYSFDRVDTSGRAMRYYNLYIHPKGRPITFMFAGISDAGEEPNDVLDEITTIRDSVRVVYVK